MAICSGVPVHPFMAGWKYETYSAIAATSSRSGSTVMKTAFSASASEPSASSHSEISDSVVGQTSGQWVKPKKTRLGRPASLSGPTVLPSWSTRVNSIASRDSGRVAAARLLPGPSACHQPNRRAPARTSAPIPRKPRSRLIPRAAPADRAPRFRTPEPRPRSPCRRRTGRSRRTIRPRRAVGSIPSA